ncbi:MAG TPA: ornithine carbamoyltransferase [Thermoprotei archaeon]|nr:ornithine carbamoyltransferase [Thermoprotei archaeon]
MKTHFRGRDFLTLMDFTREEIEFVIDTAMEFKRFWASKISHRGLEGRVVGLLFEKPSTRTRVSFMAALAHLGATPLQLNPNVMQLSRGEPIKDTARVLDRYLDALVIRTFGQEVVEEYARYMVNPVINALTDLTHPMQGLADLMTIWEFKGRYNRVKIGYVGDIWNVCHSLMIISSIFGYEMYIARPSGYDADKRILDFVYDVSKNTGANIQFTDDVVEAFKDADVIYANTWHSMGGPEMEKEKRLRDWSGYQANTENTRVAKEDYIFMHCLPGYRGEEMTDEIIEGRHSVVFEQAENRLHTEKAVLSLVIP